MRTILAAAVLSLFATPAIAGQNLVVFALQLDKEQVRYSNGVPRISLEQAGGGVQVESLPFDHGGLSFSIAVFNGGDTPATIDISSISIAIEGKPVQLFSRDELERKAKSRARWAQIGMAVVGGLAAASASSQRDYYHSTFRTPHGTYRSTFSAPSTAGQLEGAALIAGTGVAINRIGDRLDDTLASLGAETLQLTTVDPGDSYGGRIVTVKVKPKALPARIDITVNWNGEPYRFGFQLAKAGSPLPPFRFPPRPKREPAPALEGTGAPQVAVPPVD